MSNIPDLTMRLDGRLDSIPTDKPALWFTVKDPHGRAVNIHLQKNPSGAVEVLDDAGKILGTVTDLQDGCTQGCDSNHPFKVQRIWPHGVPQCRPSSCCAGCNQLPIPFVTVYSCTHTFCCVSPVDVITNAIPLDYP